jgi:hypothetical protein
MLDFSSKSSTSSIIESVWTNDIELTVDDNLLSTWLATTDDITAVAAEDILNSGR